MTRPDGVVTVNGRVHAVCTATKKPTIYQVFTEHFEKCPQCVVYVELKEWEDAQARAIFATGLYGSVVCGVSCAKCRGYTGKLFHGAGSQPPRKGMYGRQWEQWTK